MMVNLPVADTFWVRAAASLTKRDGFDYNSHTDRRVNDRDLWSTRLSAAWEPSDNFRANLAWEHFEEDDRRARTGKMLCTRDPGPTKVGNTVVTSKALRDRLSQGCLPGSLYSDAAYSAPNAASLAYMFVAGGISGGTDPVSGRYVNPIDFGVDPYEGVENPRNLREFSMSYDPVFRAKNDVVQLNVEFDLPNNLKFVSQTTYSKDDYYSSQDYARYLSNPIINDMGSLIDVFGEPFEQDMTTGGLYYDPQLGWSNRMISADLSQSDNKQIYQEFRLASDWSNGVNFSVGANYLNFKTQDDYYVFNNIFTMIAEYWYNSDISRFGLFKADCDDTQWKECVYVDPTSLNDLDGDGHNYFRSLNKVKVESMAVFGEFYWDVSSDVRLTAGLRYTDDTKVTTPYPSELLLGADDKGEGAATGGYRRRGFSALPDVKQNWQAVTGRLVADWKPKLTFTDDTLIYASYARGYKGGGTNPPRMNINPVVVQYQPLESQFDPEYVNAFEIGSKNTLIDGGLRLNATAFYYDYKDYQVSQITDRISLNENFDARSWGVELETIFQPNRNFRVDANLGYLNTRLGDGSQSIDVMNRAQGNEDWVVVRPWLQVPSNCIAPREHVEAILNSWLPENFGVQALSALCGGSVRTGTFDPNFSPEYGPIPLYMLYGFTYDYRTAPNGGRGFYADISGNELPNSPNWTANIGMQYSWFPASFEVTLRLDHYFQSSSYARVYNTEYDRLKSWDNTNVSLGIYSDDGLAIQAYVKNVFDKSPLTDAFTNSDDTGLPANVFTLDPRLYAISVSKKF